MFGDVLITVLFNSVDFVVFFFNLIPSFLIPPMSSEVIFAHIKDDARVISAVGDGFTRTKKILIIHWIPK